MEAKDEEDGTNRKDNKLRRERRACYATLGLKARREEEERGRDTV
jgi:hypothetical protein